MRSTGKYIKVFDEKRGCMIFEHDKVWLDVNGLYELKSIQDYGDGSYVIHHINGNRSDNRIENLQLLTRSEHAILHAKHREPDYGKKISRRLTGIKRSEETKKRMSTAQKANPSMGMLGKHHSKDTKQRIRESNIKTWSKKSVEEKAALNEKNRQQHLGRPAPNKGVPCPTHQREQLSKLWKERYANGFTSPSLGRIFVTNGIENHQIKPDELQHYLKLGYRRGMTRKKKR